jgi:hypothetical protein
MSKETISTQCYKLPLNGFLDSVVGKRGLFMYRIASLFLLQRLKGSMSGDARDFNNIGTRAVIKFPPPPPRQGAEANSRHSDTNIRGTCTIVCHRKNWVAQFKRAW